ncbi:PhoH-like protein [Candidatus Bealeia paramacronuclearis]|uniref:PhoH-like protein n=1 Tax=Candidatus Bealeia paramacronuclearis TaxID=1921001 RepID=A0ABZ2C2M0_9PROT|nr:PhoH-like protein [Candidatus Bealeia paramacronuclearis]
MPSSPSDEVISYLEFEDNRFLPELFGFQDRNLKFIEGELQVKISTRGNQVAIKGLSDAVDTTLQALNTLYDKLKNGQNLEKEDLPIALRHSGRMAQIPESAVLMTKKRPISARTPMQGEYIEALKTNELVFAVGPAGTGKTYLAVAAGVALMLEGQVDRIILSRPAVEAGEHLGFLPGDLREKVDPYLRPLYDALHDMLPHDQVARKLAIGEIEIAPLAFMRGRTLSNSVIILDEAQNTTPVQMKMFLTRLGHNSRMIVTGDLTQIDLPMGSTSGLSEAVHKLKDVKGIGFVHLTDADVVRHPLVARIVQAYERREI